MSEACETYGLFIEKPNPCVYEQQLTNLVNSFPLLGDSDVAKSCEKTLATALSTNLENKEIEPEPSSVGFASSLTYKYNGSYDGYRSAFYSYGSTAASREAVKLMQGLDFVKNAVTNVTNEIVGHASVNVDTTKLNEDMSGFKDEVSKQCTQLYIAVFKYGYNPTATALSEIPENDREPAAQELDQCIKGGQFTANVNWALSGDVDSSRGATWFLYNLWTCLTALNFPDVNGAIREYKQGGLNVPLAVDAEYWDTGHYHSWLQPSTGSYLYSGTMTKGMPEIVTTVTSGGYSRDRPTVLSQGYSHSFCEYGDLAAYKPSSSCFGPCTGVLMADGTVKAVKDVRQYDIVQTTQGPRGVLMVETPRLGDRDLWNINELQLWVTEGHCFRSASKELFKRIALNELVCMDSAPTMFMSGEAVGKCKIGSEIVAKCKSSQSISDGSVEVRSVTLCDKSKAIQSSKSEQNRVYDIILKNWWLDDAAYFVGGPDTFLAVDAETSNPMSDGATSAAILAAMDVALSVCDNYEIEARRLVSRCLLNIDLAELETRATEMMQTVYTCVEPQSLVIPKVELYETEDGSWNEIASYMEYFLISKFGRWIRSVIRNRAEPSVKYARPDDKLTIGIHDIELRGDFGIPANSSLSAAVTISNGSDGCEQQNSTMLLLDCAPELLFFLALHKRFVFDHADRFEYTLLRGRLLCNDQDLGFFESSFSLCGPFSKFLDVFLYATDHRVMGRMGLSVRRVQEARVDFSAEDENLMLAKGVAVGRQLGHQIAAALEAYGSRRDFSQWVR